MPGTGAAAQAIIADRLNAAVAAEISGVPGSHNVAMSLLGEGLHTLQDQFAHDYQGAGWLTHLFGNPDDPLAHPEEYGMAQDASTNYLKMYLDRIKRCSGR